MARNRRNTIACALAAGAALLLVAVLPSGAAASCVNPKPNPNDQKSEDVVTDWASACDVNANKDCPSCFLWTKVAALGKKDYVYSPSNKRSKILPTRPLAGLESIVRDKKDVSSLFTQALVDANKGKVLPANGGALARISHPIAYANSLNARQQHQLHIHVGAADSSSTFYECVKNIINKPPTTGQWTDQNAYDAGSVPCMALGLKGKPVVIYATSSAGNQISNTIREGFLNRVQVHHSKDITVDPVLLHTGVLVQPSPKGDYLVFLIVGTNDVKIFGNKS